jgi:hypothetical protein
MITALDAIPRAPAATAERWWKRVAALAVAGAIAAGAWFYTLNARTAWAREQAIPEIERLIDAGRWFDAFQLAAEARRVIPMDPAWARLDPVVTRRASIQTVPDGATVCYQSGQTIGVGHRAPERVHHSQPDRGLIPTRESVAAHQRIRDGKG